LIPQTNTKTLLLMHELKNKRKHSQERAKIGKEEEDAGPRSA
jgi:hypothetical protein